MCVDVGFSIVALPGRPGTVHEVRSRRVLLVLSGLVVSVVSAVAVIAVSGGLDTKAGPSYWEKRILACQDKSLLTTDEVLDHAYDCLKGTIRDAVLSESFDAWYQAAAPVMANDVKLEYVCHIPGHDLGAEFVEYFDGDFRRAVMTLGYDICGGGIVHGVFDVWGKQPHPLSTWLEIGDACIEQNRIRYSTCGDAVGHAAYESTGQDLAAAIGICDLLPEAWIQNSCANGAFMQKYYPQSSALKYTRKVPIPAWEELVDFCDELPTRNVGTLDGCYGGAGWVIGNTIFMNMSRLADTGDEYVANAAQQRAVVEQAGEAIKACESNVPANKGNPQVCIDLMLNRMPLFWYMDTDRFEQYCREVTGERDDQFFLRCLAGGAEHIDAGPLQALTEKYPTVGEIIKGRNPVLAGLVGVADPLRAPAPSN
jgi:hypothetical protein